MEYLETVIPTWATEKNPMVNDNESIFSALTSNWQKKRPIWIVILLQSCNEILISSIKDPPLDYHLTILADEEKKTVSSVETAEEQCSLFNDLNKTVVSVEMKQKQK